MESLEKRVKQLEATWNQDENQLLLGGNEMSNSPNGGGVLKATPITIRQETLERYGKSSTEHFALTLEASTDGAKTTPGELLHHKRHLSASSDCSSAAGAQDVFCRYDRLEKGEGGDDQLPNMLGEPLPLNRSQSKFLIDEYFKTIHPIWPIVIESESRKLFHEINVTRSLSEPVKAALLYLMMSLACQSLEEKPEPVNIATFDALATSKRFYHYAQSYIYPTAFAGRRVTVLQALLLMALYQQNTMQFIECYLTVGHAARMAQSLGFHISRPDKASIRPEHRELQRRLWWACFCLDR